MDIWNYIQKIMVKKIEVIKNRRIGQKKFMIYKYNEKYCYYSCEKWVKGTKR